MANNTTAGSQTAPDVQRFREVVAAAVGELRSAEIRKTFVALSIEELVDQHISEMEAGASLDPMKPSRMDRLTQVYTDLVGNIAAMKALPPESFAPSDNNGAATSGTGGTT